MGPVGYFFVIFFSVVIVLGLVGLLIAKRRAKKNIAQNEADEFLSEETIGNVLNLNDQFNRARYMDKDGN